MKKLKINKPIKIILIVIIVFILFIAFFLWNNLVLSWNELLLVQAHKDSFNQESVTQSTKVHQDQMCLLCIILMNTAQTQRNKQAKNNFFL